MRRPAPTRPPYNGLRLRRGRRQTITETVLALMVVLLIAFSLLQVGIFYKNQMIADHAAFVTARSYVVGFSDDIVHRAQEVGSIGMAGALQTPAAYASMTPLELADAEPRLIEQFLQTQGYTLYYEYWDRISRDVRSIGTDGMNDFRVSARGYPVEMPMHRAYMNGDTVDFDGEVRMFNHAGLYLE